MRGLLLLEVLATQSIHAQAVGEGQIRAMEPTLLEGDHVYIGLIKEFRRGDVVAFHSPRDPDVIVVKRLVGIPGDRVRLSNNTLILNSRPVPEKYKGEEAPGPHVSLAYIRNFPIGGNKQPAGVLSPSGMDMLRKYIQGSELVVPQGNYFVLGGQSGLLTRQSSVWANSRVDDGWYRSISCCLVRSRQEALST